MIELDHPSPQILDRYDVVVRRRSDDARPYVVEVIAEDSDLAGQLAVLRESTDEAPVRVETVRPSARDAR